MSEVVDDSLCCLWGVVFLKTEEVLCMLRLNVLCVLNLLEVCLLLC